MKNWLLIIVCFLPFPLLAQLHEIQLEYQPIKKEEMGQGGGLNYYFNLLPQFALGVKGSFYKYEEEYDYFKIDQQTFSVDLIHRLSFVDIKNLRIYGELGGSYTNEFYHNRYIDDHFFIGCGVGVIFPEYFYSGPIRINRIGLVAAAGMDYSFLNKLTLGFNYSGKAFLINDQKEEGTKVTDPLLNLYLGYKF